MIIRPPIITDRQAYESAVKRELDPLCADAWKLPMSIELRKEIQREMFGKNNAVGNEKFYRYCLEHKPMICEECKKPIRNPSAVNVSHILSRGAHPECSHDPRNVNILCWECHQKWENGDRDEMLIYENNQRIINQLKKEYNEYGTQRISGKGNVNLPTELQ